MKPPAARVRQLGPERARRLRREGPGAAGGGGRRRPARHQIEHARDRGFGFVDRRGRTAGPRHVEQLAQAFEAPHVKRIRGQRAPDIRDLVIDRDQRALRIARRIVERDQRARALTQRIQLGRAPERGRRALRVAAEIAQDRTDAQVQGRALGDVDQPRLGGAQGLDRRLPLALAQVQIGEALEWLRVAGTQAAGAPQRLHGACPVLERLVARRQVQPGVRRPRIVRRDGEELHQPVRGRFGIPVLAGPMCQLEKGLAVFRVDLQNLLEVCERRLAVGDPLQAVLAALEQQGHAGRRRQRRRGQPVGQQRVEQDAPPRRLENRRAAACTPACRRSNRWAAAPRISRAR